MNWDFPPSSVPEATPEKEPISDEQIIEALKQGVDSPETKALWTEWIRQQQEKVAESAAGEREVELDVVIARTWEKTGIIDEALAAWEDVQTLAANTDDPGLWDTAQEAIELLQAKKADNS